MAEIRKLKDPISKKTVYPQTVAEAVSTGEGTVADDLLALQSANTVFRAGLRFKAGVKFSKTPKSETSASTGTALRTAPSLVIRGKGDDRVLHVNHPMMNTEGAEIVLLRYIKRNGKAHNQSPRGLYKKGYCVASGKRASNYFAFSEETPVSSLISFLQANIVNVKRHFGIALRIPNPDYTGPATKLKNATFKGVPESLWSDVLGISISNHNGNYWGVGII